MIITETELMKYKSECDVFVGIDPDCDESGVAVVHRGTRDIDVCKEHFFEIFEHFERLLEYNGKVVVVIEGGWLNQGNWHIKNCRISPAKAAAIGRHVGMNHQTGILITQMCDELQIPYEVVKPLPKHWAGSDGKITAKELEYFTGYSRRTNQDERDAILLAWNYAGLPIRVKSIGG